MKSGSTDQWREIIAILGGTLCGLLIVRLVLKLLAARPASPTVAWLYGLTEPLVTPLTIIDRSQPRFGAVLEFSTLTTLLLIVSVTGLLWVWLGPRKSG
ncbi:MAG: hypothetical protein KatS3mg055_3716 [Chloroflexus sp.]|jgi:uncharacterized protein YggT (Ycf19 family)|uniref:YggT family protein n=1 Tax=Chloroflexus sp. TaxID=1904827 RepID=UPI000F249D84|nr:YggT family protein [Chloroflexus sp.]RMD73873.1 MAG: YggT family protein [Chloroflexota bacterium]GIV91198.1 MAG: hypothetical protein KatS3mg055_3716 [Chloroflexus sp.]